MIAVVSALTSDTIMLMPHAIKMLLLLITKCTQRFSKFFKKQQLVVSGNLYKKNIHLRGSSIQKFDAKIMRLLDAVFPKNLRMKELHVIFSANDEKFIMC